jgi:mevalonate pyrophosphate decarboxylase
LTGAKQAAKALLPQEKAQGARIRKIMDALKTKKRMTPKTRVYSRSSRSHPEAAGARSATQGPAAPVQSAPSGPISTPTSLVSTSRKPPCTPGNEDDQAANAENWITGRACT